MDMSSCSCGNGDSHTMLPESHRPGKVAGVLSLSQRPKTGERVVL